MILKQIPGIPPEHCGRIFDLFQEVPGGTELILFGSRAKGNFREGSDIDLALKGPNLTHEYRSQLLCKYEDLYLPWKLDVVLYHSIETPALKEHIDRCGILLLDCKSVT